MGKTSKFSFPLPGRKQRPNSGAQAGANPQAEMPKLSKAERLLGATGLPINNLPQNQRNQNPVYSDLHKQHSSLTLTVYEPSVYDDALGLEPPIPEADIMPSLPEFDGKLFRHAGPPPRSMSVNQRSPGKTTPERKGHPRSMSNGSIPITRQFKSENNLHNQYQLKAFPSISEKSSTTRGERVIINSKAPWEPVSPKKQPSLPSDSPTRGQAERKRPSRLDLSKIFPKSPTSTTGGQSSTFMSSPTSLFSASHDSYISRISKAELRSPVGSTKHNKLTKSRPAQRQELSKVDPGPTSRPSSRPRTAGETHSRSSAEQSFTIRRSNERKQATTTKNWFDGLLEAEDAIDVDMEDHTPEAMNLATPRYLPKAQDRSIRLVDRSSPVMPSPILPTSMDMCLRRSSCQGTCSQSLRASVTEVQIKRASIASTVQSPNMSALRRDSVATLTTPVQASFNFTKSSEKVQEDHESDADEEFFDVRDSIALSELDGEISIGEAQAFHVKTGHFLEPAPKPKVTDSQHPIHRVATIQPPREWQNQSSIHEYSDDRMVAGLAISKPDIVSPLMSPQSAVHKQSEPKHKLMAVTEEEEALLEMMRQKRAAMVSHNFAAGYKTALMSSPQSPMFMNAKRESLSGVSPMSATRSWSSRPGPGDYLYDNIDPPLSPPPTEALPPPPEYLGDENDSSALREQSMQSSHSNSVQHSNTVSLVIANLDPSHPQYNRDPAESAQQLDSTFRYAMAGSPSSGSGFSLPLSNSSTNGSGASALPSPVTPHAVPAAGLDLIMIANSSSRGSDVSMDEMLEHRSELSSKTHARRATTQYLPASHRPQMSNNTVINMYLENSAHTEGTKVERGTAPEQAPKSDFEKRMAEIRAKTMAATLAATKAYSIDTIRRRNRLMELQEQGQGQELQPDAVSLAIEEAVISYPTSPTHVHSGSGCCAHLKTRCSVAEDVMEAWNSLGGWNDLGKYREFATIGEAA